MTQSIYTAVNLASPIWAQGLSPVSFTNTTVTYGVGAGRGITNGWELEYNGAISGAPGNITINTAVVGANGCYPNPLASIVPESGVVIAPVYFVGNSSGTTDGSLNGLVLPALVIGTANSNFVPLVFDTFLQIGFIVVNSSGNLVPYDMQGYRERKEVMFQDPLLVLNGGDSATNATVDLSPLPVNGTVAVYLQYAFTPGSQADVLSLKPTGLTPGSTYPVTIVSSAAEINQGLIYMPVGYDATNVLPAIDYKLTSDSDSVSLWVSGFSWEVPITYL